MRRIFTLDREQVIQEYLIQPVEQYLDLERWGFKLNYITQPRGYVVIYDSNYCRLRCSLSFDPRDEYDSILTSYARLHAPDEEWYMVYKDEKCEAWHDIVIGYVGQFLDGMSPHELGQLINKRIRVPCQATNKFEEEWLDKGLRNPIWGLMLDQSIWDYYDERLFELFDLQQSELWEKYRQFLQELYIELQKDPIRKAQLEDKPDWKPYPWQVC